MQYYIYSLVCFLLPGTVWLVWNRRMTADKAYKVRHIIWVYIYMFYGYLAVQEAAGIGSIWDLITYGKLDNSINLIPFSSEGAMTYILNIIMFMPLGFLLPLIWENFRNAKKVVLMGFLMSLTIEICQLFNIRTTDIDDLMMNTLGALVGYCCWKVFSLVFRNAGTKCVEIKKSEPVIYMFGGILGLFLLYNWRVFN
uniref:VanZ family protein n=1 Tax=Agathobacter sp. TaxID=2021311 RepID=UPI003FEE8F97